MNQYPRVRLRVIPAVFCAVHHKLLNVNPPTQAVCECGGTGHMPLSINHRIVSSRTQRPKRRRRARQVQTNVPERIYRSGDTTATEQKQVVTECVFIHMCLY